MSNKQELQKAVKVFSEGKKDIAKTIKQIAENNRQARREQEAQSRR